MNEIVSSAGSVFSWGFYVTVGTILFVTISLMVAKAYRRVVEPNEVHVVRNGKKTTIYGEQEAVSATAAGEKAPKVAGNTYYEWPSWWPKFGVQAVILPLDVFDEELVDYEAYDVGRVPFAVDIVAFFRISDPQTAAKRVRSMDELQKQLRSILQGAVRTILAKHDIEQIMGERSTFGKIFTEEVTENLKAWGVSNVKNIELMDIRDGKNSKTVSNIMAKKESQIEKESRVEVAANRRDARVAEIEAKQVEEVREQEKEQKVGERTAEKDKLVGIADEKAKQEIKEQAKITAEKQMMVFQVEQVRQAEINKDVRIVKAEEQKQVDITETEGVKAQTILKAEGDLKDQQLHAQGVLAVGEAEAEAKRLAEMALVTPQIALAEEIGENKGYQTYLVDIRGVEKDETVGVANAKALQDAGIKIIVNSGDVNSGMDNILDVFSTKGGTNIAGALEALSNMDEGKALLKRLGIGGSDTTEPKRATAETTVTKKPLRNTKPGQAASK